MDSQPRKLHMKIRNGTTEEITHTVRTYIMSLYIYVCVTFGKINTQCMYTHMSMSVYTCDIGLLKCDMSDITQLTTSYIVYMYIQYIHCTCDDD